MEEEGGGGGPGGGLAGAAAGMRAALRGERLWVKDSCDTYLMLNQEMVEKRQRLPPLVPVSL